MFLLKKLNSKINPFKRLKIRFDGKLKNTNQEYARNLTIISREFLEIKRYLRFAKKEKIRVVFVCHRPQIWRSLKTIFDACIEDNDFEVIIVAIPNKKQLPKINLSHEIYETEGAEEFFKNYSCTVLNGFNYSTNTWYDLQQLNADYLFFQTPYNICRPPQYNSKIVSLYTRVCYMHYGISMLKTGVIDSFAEDYLKNMFLIFAETPYHQKYYFEQISKYDNFYSEDHIKLTGYPGFDNIEKYKQISKENNKFKILWTPRWCISEGNCTFVDYRDKLFNYAEQYDVDFIFRPHPQAFLNYVAEGIMTENEIAVLRSRCQKSANLTLDEGKEYLETIYSSDVLVTDPSGMVFEYCLSEKPIIYCHKTLDWANEYSQYLFQGFYWVRNWKELENTLNMLKFGEDPLKEKRLNVINSLFYLPKEGAGYRVKEILKQEFYK